MKYDPIKRSLGVFFNKSVFLRKLFYRLLDILLLRTWHVHKAVRRLIGKRNEKLKILDAGMGFGQYSFWMASQNKKWSITGVDVKKEQIEDCSVFFKNAGLSNAGFHFADLTKYVVENHYDFILSVDVMEHIEEDVQVFQNFHASLADDGVLLVSTPSDKCGSDVHEHEHEHHENDGTLSFVDEHVRDGYNIDEIQEKLKTAGFSKTEALYAYGSPGKISWKLSMKYPILMLNASKLFFVLIPFYYLLTMPFLLVLIYLDLNGKHKTGTGLIVKAWK